MKTRHHLTQSERDRIQALLDSGHKKSEVARVLGRPKGTISKEIKRNRKRSRLKHGFGKGPYLASLAQIKARNRRRYAKFQWKKINKDDRLRKHVIQGLESYWSPDEIAGRMKFKGRPFYSSKTAIYDWLYSARGQSYCPYLYSLRYRPRKRREKKLKKALIPNRTPIQLRPKEQEQEYGHYEGDTALSGRKTGSKAALAVIRERKAKYLEAEKIPCLSPKEFNLGVSQIKNRLFSLKSLTLDNGIENTLHEKLGVPTYFCDPYSSWQKGGVENGIMMLRRFFPKGTDIANYSSEYIRKTVSILNNKPRKSLGYRTPLEVMLEQNLLKDTCQNIYKIKTPEVSFRG